MRNIFIITLLLLAAAPALNATDRRAVDSAGFSDIFLTTQKSDIQIIPSPDAAKTTVYWNGRFCNMDINYPAKDLLEIKVTPQRQHVFLKWMLGIQKPPCKIRLEAPPDKNIYASSREGNIKAANIKVKHLRLYTAEGNIDVENTNGSLKAETLTGKITARNITAQNLSLKSADGTITFHGTAVLADILNTGGASKLQGVIEELRYYSAGGNVTARWDALPGSGRLKISARSFAGDIKIILPRGTDHGDKKHAIALKSIYGEITITDK